MRPSGLLMRRLVMLQANTRDVLRRLVAADAIDELDAVARRLDSYVTRNERGTRGNKRRGSGTLHAV